MTPAQTKRAGTTRLVDTIGDAEHTSLEAVRKFVDTVDSVFPHLGGDDGPRRKIIDSAFEMTEQLVAASTRFAQNFLDGTQKALTESGRKSAPKAAAKKAGAKKAPGRRTTAKRAPTRKVAARKTAAKKSTAKRASARKTTAKRASARKAPARKAAARRR
jgi:hypothetical protein